MTFLTTRFTDETWAENQRYRDTHLVPCIYGLGVPISDKHPHTPLYVLEMNNSTNQLLGIGVMTKKYIPESRSMQILIIIVTFTKVTIISPETKSQLRFSKTWNPNCSRGVVI